MQLGRIVTCTAPVNIAVIKYWGKSDEELIIPLNDSLSFTLSQDQMCAKTTVMISPNFKNDRFWLNHEEQNANGQRLTNCLKEVRRRTSKRKLGDGDRGLAEWHVHIYSVNNFPTAAGLASSAAGYACLVFALGRVFELEDDLTSIARLGSGSACRSLAGGMVQWFKGEDECGTDSVAKQIAPINYWGDLHVIICVASDDRKKVSSTVGMRRCAGTCFMKHRISDVLPDRLNAIKCAIKNKDWSSFCDIVMTDSNEMHAVCLSASPPIAYMNDTSHAISSLVHQYNSTKITPLQKETKVCYTFDAGPNACLFIPSESVTEFASLLNKNFSRELSYNSPSTNYWQGIALQPFDDKNLNEIPNSNEISHRHSVKYFIHTNIGDGPIVLPASESSHLLSPDTGLPLERKSNDTS